MLYFLISALRAIVEMLGLSLLAQGVLYFVAGSGRAHNPVYQLFALISRGPRRMVARILPASCSPLTVAVVTFILLFCLWIGLAIFRGFH